jgi:hypothetical protein
VARVGDEQDHASDPEVTLLGAHSSFERLNILDSSFGLDHRVETVANDDCVRAPPIPRDRDWDFGAELEGGWQSPTKSLDQGQMGCIAHGIAVGMK